MNRLLLVIFTIINFSVSAQTIEVENIEHGSHIIANDSIVIVVGHNYKSDGYGQSTIINTFDTTLKLKWIFKLDSFHTNIIDKIKITDSNIILTGLVGENDNKNLKTSRFIKILNFDGKIILDKIIGTSGLHCTNIIEKDNKIYFCYSKNETTLYAQNTFMDSSKNILVEYNLKTNKIKKLVHFLTRSWPKYLTLIENNFYLIGVQHNKQLDTLKTFITNFKFKNKNILLPTGRLEEFYTILEYNQELTNVSCFNPYNEKEKKYLRFNTINLKSKLSSTKTISFTKLGWDDVCTDPKLLIEYPSQKRELLFYVYKSDLEASFVQIDKNGLKLSETKSNILKYSLDFFPTEKFIYHLYSEDNNLKNKIKLIRLKR